jgi:hypothetical protein
MVTPYKFKICSVLMVEKWEINGGKDWRKQLWDHQKNGYKVQVNGFVMLETLLQCAFWGSNTFNYSQ